MSEIQIIEGMAEINTKVIEVAEAILCDDQGLSEKGYTELMSLISMTIGQEYAHEVSSLVNATDGRFYILDTTLPRPTS